MAGSLGGGGLRVKSSQAGVSASRFLQRLLVQ
nr:MAG TPA: hypothetical protein [Caudoviricetes sp.]